MAEIAGARQAVELQERGAPSEQVQAALERTGVEALDPHTLRVTLVQLRAGTTVDPSATAGAASLQVLQGRIALQTGGRTTEVGAGQLVILSENLREPLRATEDSTLLVTVAWEEGAGAWDEEEASGQH